ncbi:MAG: hypothetical protein OJF49_004366 [Ktedonobacterales bacterium]|nr:MAG: hypothetical protein OJF49_004366 [Ktedonobacterales bacterium]
MTLWRRGGSGAPLRDRTGILARVREEGANMAEASAEEASAEDIMA